VRTPTDIKTALDRAMARRTELWRELARGRDARAASELARLNDRIPALWEELRIARIRERHGSPEPILRRLSQPEQAISSVRPAQSAKARTICIVSSSAVGLDCAVRGRALKALRVASPAHARGWRP